MKTLSPSKMDAIETQGLHAFLGRAEKLVNGVRFIRDKMQVAAVYWSDNAPDNEIEIALCDSRLTDRYNLGTVHAWLDHEKRQFPYDCNIHKHGSDWPIVGMRYVDALNFLKRCRELRLGLLDKALVASFAANARVQPAAAAAEAGVRVALSGLLPQSHQDVIDLVSRAGVDVSGWYRKKDGLPAQSPRSNPNYCYNWAFGGNDQPAVICLWHSDLSASQTDVIFTGNFREHAASLSRIADTAGEAPDVRSRARSQAERAKQLDSLVAEVAQHERPLRVIVVEGHRRSDEGLGKESSIVKRRKLDSARWYVQRYVEATGELLLVREALLPQVRLPAAAEPAPYVDQFAEPAARRDSSSSAFIRKKSVRDAVLARAKGVCELCGMAGFATPSGAIYLETHHVIPLSEAGPDVEQNVVALCPNDHRQAHFGTSAASVRAILLKRLSEQYPASGATGLAA